MSRRPNLVPTQYIRVGLPQDIYTKLNLHLFSELEGRIPLGAFQSFFTERVREYFFHKKLDLAPFCGCEPGIHFVSGSPASLEVLQKAFMKEIA